MIFIKYGNAKITGKFNAFGITIDIQDESVIFVCLWIACIYFLVRYYQFYNSEPADQKYRSIFSGYYQKLEKRLEADLFRNQLAGKPLSVSYSRIGKLSQDDGSIIFTARYQPDPKNELTQEELQVTATKDVLWWLKARSAWYVISRTPVVLEYYFPFALSFAALIYTLSG